jgi:hypothetical protein
MARLDDTDLEQVLRVAIAASKRAGAIILGNAGGAEVAERKANSRDLLTLLDPLCEKVRASTTGRSALLRARAPGAARTSQLRDRQVPYVVLTRFCVRN